MRRPTLPQVIALLVLLALGGVAWRVVGDLRFRDELGRAKREVAGGSFSEARGRLARLAARRPEHAEVRYQLGICEERLGRPAAATEQWSRVPSGPPLGPQAALLRARVLIRSFGKLAEAEPLLVSATRGPVPTASSARWALAELCVWEGRVDDARRLLEAAWSRAGKADDIPLLREHWRLDSVVVSEEDVRPVLDASAKHAPGDDRACLVRAALATRYGRFEEAARWLKACRDARPGDPAVDRVGLSWALAAGRPDEAASALGRLPADRFEPREILTLRAWFAARRKDLPAERRILEALIECDPGDSSALDRLIALRLSAGDKAGAAELRRRESEVDRAKDDYRWRLISLPADPHLVPAADLARLAESLGRDFEAQGWWTLALANAPDDPGPRAELERHASRAVPRRLPEASFEALTADLAAMPPTAPPPRATTAPPAFVDGAEDAGLRFAYENGKTPSRQVPETMGGGAGLLDYDGDGFLDVYLVQGGAFPPRLDRPGGGDRLFRNRGDGTFEDATERAGIARLSRGYGHGVAVGDIDNDGHPDLFVTRWRAYALYRNRGDGTFEEITERAGFGGDRDWPTSAAFADLDNDGDLDLYVCHYLEWDAEHPTLCPSARDPRRHVSCLPRLFPSRPDHLFRNDGGRFADVTDEAGIVDRDGRGLGVVAGDLDGDGLVDLYVANDQTANFFFRNRGGLTFEEAGFASGVACGADGVFRAGMGVACGDLDGDGLPDLAVTNFFGESSTFFRNLGGGAFGDETATVGLLAPSRFLLGFGVAFLDANNDGRLDLATANGHVNDDRERAPYEMPAQLLEGGEDGRLRDVSERAGPPWRRPVVGRGLAAGDLDNDGRVDVLIVPQAAPVVLAGNRTRGGHFLTLRLEGTRSNRDAVGARVAVRCGGRQQTSWRLGGGSYQSASDPRLHFGLGAAANADEVEVTWPSGRVERFRDLPGDAGYLLREGGGSPLPLAGFGPEAERKSGQDLPAR